MASIEASIAADGATLGVATTANASRDDDAELRYCPCQVECADQTYDQFGGGQLSAPTVGS